MALIACPDCGKQVSDSAATCIGCGRPLRFAASTSIGSADAPVVIEQSSKKYKGGMLFGLAIALLGFVIGMSGGATGERGAVGFGLAVMAIGIACFIGYFIARWWHHG